MHHEFSQQPCKSPGTDSAVVGQRLLTNLMQANNTAIDKVLWRFVQQFAALDTEGSS